MKKLTQEEIAFIISNPNMSSRKICYYLWGDKKRKSTVNDLRKKLREATWDGTETSPSEQPVPVKICFFDIETAPALVYTFGRKKQFIQQDFVVKEGYMLSFCAKWLGDDTIASYALPYYSSYNWDKAHDEDLVRDLHKVLSEADIIVAHNLKGFDWKVAQTRFVYYGLPQIPDTKLVDTYLICRSNFMFPDNKLDTVARYLEVGQKLPHSGASLWRGCLDDDAECWGKMVEYNIVDVEVLEQVYLKIRHYDKRHPNVALYYNDDKLRCTVCGSSNLNLTDKKARSGLSQWSIYECEGCQHHVRSRTNERTKQQMQNTLANIL